MPEDIASLRGFLSGKGQRGIVDAVEQRMRDAAAAERFEEAARFRDQWQALLALRKRAHR